MNHGKCLNHDKAMTFSLFKIRFPNKIRFLLFSLVPLPFPPMLCYAQTYTVQVEVPVEVAEVAAQEKALTDASTTDGTDAASAAAKGTICL